MTLHSFAWRMRLVPLMGVLGISSAALWIRMADASSLVIALYRMLFAFGLMGVLALLRTGVSGEGKGGVISLRAVAMAVVSGICLALHFWSWIESLRFISVATSTLLVTTTPLWLALAAPFLPGESRLSRREWGGLALCLLGSMVIVGPSVSDGGPREATAVRGMIWSVAGALWAALYLFTSRVARREMSVVSLGMATNGVAALVLSLAALLLGHELWPLSSLTWWSIVAMAICSQVIGHNALLWLLKRRGATHVSMLVLLEPVGASLLAWLVLHESVTIWEALGGGLLLLGLARVVSRSGSSAS